MCITATNFGLQEENINIHRRTYGPTSIGGGGGKPSFARMDSVGGGSSGNFPGSILCGGRAVVAEICRHLPERARFGGGGG